jgi:geranylgeranyl diphosphate synthase type I
VSDAVTPATPSVAEEAGAFPALDLVRARVDPVIERFLDDRRAELAAMDPAAGELVDELRRLIVAGGKRLRPAVCFWAHQAAGGVDGDPIDRACAALELLHTFALIHDDVMDASDRRRGVPTTHVRFALRAPSGTVPTSYGAGVAIVVGDLAAVYAEQLLRTCGAPADPLAVAFDRFDRMRAEMGAGQLLDLGSDRRQASPRMAALKTGSYTAEGPALVGAALARAGPDVEDALRAYARSVGEAFQLRDDVLDGDAPRDASRRLHALLRGAISELEGAPLEPEGARALRALAAQLSLDPGDA